MPSLREQLKQHSTVDATTPSIILNGLQAEQYSQQLDAALGWAQPRSRSPEALLANACVLKHFALCPSRRGNSHDFSWLCTR